jgi:hypothetical protein
VTLVGTLADLTPGEAIDFALREHHERLIAVFTLLPGGRCILDRSDRPRVAGDRCPEHADGGPRAGHAGGA